MSEEILIVDDESDIRSLLSLTLEDEGFSTVQAANAEQARDIVSKRLPSCAILDIWMRDSDMDGLELLSWCKEIYPDMPILMISGHGTISTAVEAIRNGAYEFVEKPFKAERLILTVRRALQAKRLEIENQLLRARTAVYKHPDFIGNSSKIKRLKNDDQPQLYEAADRHGKTISLKQKAEAAAEYLEKEHWKTENVETPRAATASAGT